MKSYQLARKIDEVALAFEEKVNISQRSWGYAHSRYYQQHGGDIMSNSMTRFIKDLRELQAAAYAGGAHRPHRRDKSFLNVDKDYVTELLEFIQNEAYLKDFSNIYENMPPEEKNKSKTYLNQLLKNTYKRLISHPDWKNIVQMKEIFMSTLEPSLYSWLKEQYIKGNIPRVEDIRSRLVPAIEDFKWLQKNNILSKKDSVSKFDGLYDLEEFLAREELQQHLQKRQKTVNVAENEYELVHEELAYKVYHPKTQNAACHLGQGTRWCTAATKGKNMFEDYNDEGPLFIIQPKKTKYEGEKYQVHLQSGSYMNERDESITIRFLKDRFPGIADVLGITKIINDMQKMLDRIEEINKVVYDGGEDGNPIILDRSYLSDKLLQELLDELLEENPDYTEDELNEIMEDEVPDIDEHILDADELAVLSEDVRNELKSKVEAWGD